MFFFIQKSSAEVRPPSPQFSQSLNFWKYFFLESTPKAFYINSDKKSHGSTVIFYEKPISVASLPSTFAPQTLSQFVSDSEGPVLDSTNKVIELHFAAQVPNPWFRVYICA